MDNENILIKVGADITDFSRKMKVATTELDKFQSGNKETFNSFKQVGAAVTGAGLAISAGLGLAVKQAASFDTTMRKAGAIAGATTEEFNLMKAAAIKLGADTSKSAGEVATAMTEMAAKGFTATQVIAAMPGVIAASEASGESLALTADTVASALNVWGLEAGQAGKVADVLAMSANVSAASIDDLGYAFKYAGTPAAALGISLEELAAATGIMTNAGLSGSNAGTSLRESLLALLEPGKKQEKIMAGLGFSMRDANGEAKSLSEIVGDLAKATEGMSEADRLGTIAKIVGTEAASGFLTLMKAGPDVINANTAALENSAGASQEAADKMMAGIGGALEEMSGAFESAAILIGDVLVPYVQKLAKFIGELVDKFNNASPAFQKFAVIGTAVAAGLMLIVGPMLLLIGFIPSILAGFASVAVVFKAIVAPIALMTTGIKTYIATSTLAVVAQGLFTGTMTLSTAAMLLNAAAANVLRVALSLMLGPIGWIVAGLGLLVVAVIGIVKWFKKSTDEAIKLNGVTEELGESTTTLNDSIASTSDAYKASQTEINATAQANENLAAKIEELSGKEIKSAAEKAALQSHIESLNGSVNGLNLAYNEESNALSMSSEQLQARLKLIQDQEALQAGQERFLEISKEQAKVDMKLTETNALREEWNQKLEDGSVKAREHKSAIAELDEQEAQLTTTTADLAAQQIETEKQVTASVEAVAEATRISVDEQVGAYETLSDSQKDIVDSLKSTWEEYKNQATDMFNKLSEKSKVSISDMTKNLEENQRVMTNWSENIATLAKRGIDEGLLETLRTAGPESAGHVKALVNASDAELKKLSDTFASGGDVATKALSKSLGGENAVVLESVGHLVTQTGDSLSKQIQQADFASIGKAMPEGTAKGVIDGTENVVKATEDMAKQAEEATRKALEVNSPSKVFEDIGGGIPEGTIVGIEKGTPAIIQTNLNLAKIMIEQYATIYSDFQRIGKDIARGLNQGLIGGQGEVLATARNIANNVASTMRKALDIHSPSRVMAAIGAQTGTGLANGIAGTKLAVTSAITGLTNVIKSVTKANNAEILAIAKTQSAEEKAVMTKKTRDIANIHAIAKSNKRKLTFSESQRIAKIETDSAAQLIAIQRKHGAEVAKVNAGLAKDKLAAIKTYVDDKKSLEQLSLVAESEVWRKSVDMFKAGTKERVEAQKAYQASLKAVNDEVVRVNDEYVGKIQKINADLAQSEQKLTDDYNNAYSSRVSAILGFSGLFDEFAVKMEKTGRDLLNNLQSQVIGMAEWRAVIASLWGRIDDQALMEELEEMGPKALGELRALNGLSDAELSQYVALYNAKFSLAREQATHELAGMKADTADRIAELRATANTELEVLRKEWTAKIKGVTKATNDELKSLKQIGVDAGKGLLNGLASMEPALIKTARSIANSISSEISNALKIKSPSRVMMEIGQFVGAGLANGMAESVNSVRRSAVELANAAVVKPSMTYATPNANYGSLSAALSGEVNVNQRDSLLIGAIASLEDKLTNLTVEMDRKQVGRILSRELNGQIQDANRRGGGY